MATLKISVLHIAAAPPLCCIRRHCDRECRATFQPGFDDGAHRLFHSPVRQLPRIRGMIKYQMVGRKNELPYNRFWKRWLLFRNHKTTNEMDAREWGDEVNTIASSSPSCAPATTRTMKTRPDAYRLRWDLMQLRLTDCFGINYCLRVHRAVLDSMTAPACSTMCAGSVRECRWFSSLQIQGTRNIRTFENFNK